MNKIDLNGRIAVVTGGAQGIGLAIARRLAASGAQVCLWDRDGDQLDQAGKAFDAGVATETVDVAELGRGRNGDGIRRSPRSDGSTSSSIPPGSPAGTRRSTSTTSTSGGG